MRNLTALIPPPAADMIVLIDTIDGTAMRWFTPKTVLHVLTPHNLLCATTLAAFAIASVGIPYGNVGRSPQGCQCSEELKASGNCCCKNRAALQEHAEGRCRKSCCRKRNRLRTIGKCSASKPRKADSPTRKSCCRNSQAACKHSHGAGGGPMVSDCSCQGAPSSGLIVNSDPRLLRDRPPANPASPGEHVQRDARLFPPQSAPIPETPPPEAKSV
jgi:hypothetical protein